MQSHMILFRSASRQGYEDDFSVRTQSRHEPIELKRAADKREVGERPQLATLKRSAEPAHRKEGQRSKV
ncbi:MAG: hypothetical protein AAF346_20170 [Pseudomonadota bacterium]